MRCWILLIFSLVIMPAHVIASGNRIALVIGNSSYPTSPLRNPVNDATDVAATLKQLNFDVIYKTNATLLDMEKAVRDFGNRLYNEKGIGIFFYAGHGVQVNGRNYLIPIDADIQDEIEVKHEALDVDLVLGKMELAENDVNLLILDACRNNPFERQFRSGLGRGLAQMNAPNGTVIWYATRPGKVASDGKGRNSPFTHHLIKELQIKGVKAREVISNIAVSMHRENSLQEPWQEGIWLNDFYFSQATPKIEKEDLQTSSAKIHTDGLISKPFLSSENSIESTNETANQAAYKPIISTAKISKTNNSAQTAKLGKANAYSKSTISNPEKIGVYPNIIGRYDGLTKQQTHCSATETIEWEGTEKIKQQNSNGEFEILLNSAHLNCIGTAKFIKANEFKGKSKCTCYKCGIGPISEVIYKFTGKLIDGESIEMSYGGQSTETHYSRCRFILERQIKKVSNNPQ